MADLVTIEDAIAEIQRGIIKTPSFYADISLTSSHKNFMNGVNTALNFAGNIAMKNELVEQRTPETGYRLTEKEYYELQKKAVSVANFSNIPLDTAEDFLTILCFVDNLTDMTTIADAVQIAELADPMIIRVPLAILGIPKLEKVAFAASALDGLINAFRRYIYSAQNVDNKSNDGNDIGSMLSSLSNIVGGMQNSDGAQVRMGGGSDSNTLGHYLSELITGKRIPMTLIAKNPTLKSPSYEGKAYFGEAGTSLSNVDIKQLFAKKIALFEKPSNGSGAQSFAMQNSGSTGQEVSLSSFVSTILTGSSSFEEGSKKERQVNGIVEQINTFVGTSGDPKLDLRRADNAIPIMSAISSVMSGTEKSIFPTSTFQEGWSLSKSVSNHLLAVDPSYIEFMKRFM